MTLAQKEDYVVLKRYNVSKFNLTIYSKFLRKGWLIAVIPGLLMLVMGLIMGGLWPEFEVLASDPVFTELLSNPVYAALIGSDNLDFSSFQGFWALEILTILDFLMLFLVIFIPVRIISNEVDKNTLDIVLSYPIPRWQFVTQKFLVYLSQMLIFILFIIISAVISTEMIGETFNYVSLFKASLAIFLLAFSLGALSLLAGTIFLESGRALPVAAIFVIGMWILDRIGGLSENLELIRQFSIHHYMIPRDILSTGILPLDELAIVLSVGLIAFLGALTIFQRKELAY